MASAEGRAAQRRRKRKSRMRALNAYSEGSLSCRCCGAEELDFLVLDHIEDNGAQHRRKEFGRPDPGSSIYSRLSRQGFPPGFQVLCHNCNYAKHKHGQCPHHGAPPCHFSPEPVAPQDPGRRAYKRAYRQRKRKEALIKYGGQTPTCFCCHTTVLDFLTLDHIGGWGREHRSSLGTGKRGRGGIMLYLDVLKNDYTDRMRVACRNCHAAISLYGSCPHEK